MRTATDHAGDGTSRGLAFDQGEAPGSLHRGGSTVRALIGALMVASILLAPNVAGAQESDQPPLTSDRGVASGEDAWTWRNPVPQGNDLVDVAFLDAMTGWGVGREGLIMRTSDAGTNWSVQVSETT